MKAFDLLKKHKILTVLLLLGAVIAAATAFYKSDGEDKYYIEPSYIAGLYDVEFTNDSSSSQVYAGNKSHSLAAYDTSFSPVQGAKSSSVASESSSSLLNLSALDAEDGPTITAVDRWFTLEEAQTGRITREELMSTAFAEDDEADFLNGKGKFDLVDFSVSDFVNFRGAGSATVTYYAEDSSGNSAYKVVTVHIVNEGNALNGLGGNNYREIRFISYDYYLNDSGDFVDASFGGLLSNSKWVSDSTHVDILTNVLKNSNSEGYWAVDPAFTFTIDTEMVDAMKLFIESNGLGSALSAFYNAFLCELP